MVNIGICDSDIYTQNKIEALLEKFCEESKLKMEISQYCNGEEICKRAQLSQIDILFLDVKMNELSGIDVAKELRKVNYNAKLIFISKTSECIPDLFDYEASGYIGKPIDEDKFNRAIWRVSKRLLQSGEKFYYSAARCLYNVEKRKIVYFESNAHIILIHKENNELEKFRDKLSNVGKQLSSPEFLRIGKSYIVNLNKVKKMNRKSVIMDDGSKIAISRNYSNEVIKAYCEFMEGKKRQH